MEGKFWVRSIWKNMLSSAQIFNLGSFEKELAELFMFEVEYTSLICRNLGKSRRGILIRTDFFAGCINMLQ